MTIFRQGNLIADLIEDIIVLGLACDTSFCVPESMTAFLHNRPLTMDSPRVPMTDLQLLIDIEESVQDLAALYSRASCINYRDPYYVFQSLGLTTEEWVKARELQDSYDDTLALQWYLLQRGLVDFIQTDICEPCHWYMIGVTGDPTKTCECRCLHNCNLPNDPNDLAYYPYVGSTITKTIEVGPLDPDEECENGEGCPDEFLLVVSGTGPCQCEGKSVFGTFTLRRVSPNWWEDADGLWFMGKESAFPFRWLVGHKCCGSLAGWSGAAFGSACCPSAGTWNGTMCNAPTHPDCPGMAITWTLL